MTRKPARRRADARKAPRADLPGHVTVGIVAGPHGVRGRVRVKAFTAAPEDIAAYGPVTTADGRRFRLTVEGAAKGAVIARIEGIETRNAAEALKGLTLHVPRAALPEPGEDEFYHADLLGLLAVRANGEVLGRVTAIHDFGAGDLLEITLAADGRTVFVPFTRETAPEIDIAAGRLVCEPPEALLESGPPREEEEEEEAS